MLTDNVIDKMTSYYGKAFRDNKGSTVPELRKSILSSYMHSISTDADPKHNLCPAGEDSWCFVKRAEAVGEVPASHASKKFYLAKIPAEKRQGIANIYADLTQTELLEHCSKCRMQNPYESLHSKVWAKTSKSKFAGKKRVRFLSQVTVLEHNFGIKKASLLVKLGLSTTLMNRSLESFQSASTTPSPRRKRRRSARHEEDTTAYAPGAF